MIYDCWKSKIVNQLYIVAEKSWILNKKKQFSYVLKGKYHEMVCQLRLLVYSLGLNNPPRICLTPWKSLVKNL
jgi:hypothetical protein